MILIGALQRVVVLALLTMSLGLTGGFAAVSAARNCELASPPNTGDAAHQFQPDQVEITFCGNRRLTQAELQLFTAAERLTLITISSDAGQTLNAYYFQIAPGVAAPDRVRQLAENPDIRSVGVVPIGAPTVSSAQPTNLPSTGTSARDTTSPAPAMSLVPAAVAVLVLATLVGLLIFRAMSRKRRGDRPAD